jgi:hypothetical protein
MKTLFDFEIELIQERAALEKQIRKMEDDLLSLKEVYLKISGGLDVVDFVKKLPEFQDKAATRIRTEDNLITNQVQ